MSQKKNTEEISKLIDCNKCDLTERSRKINIKKYNEKKFKKM